MDASVQAGQLLARARSFLFLPAIRLDRLPKALDSGAHVVILDLEDAVAPEAKAQARQAIAALWTTLPVAARARLLVRINASSTLWYSDDVQVLRSLSGLGGVMPPKIEGPTAMRELAEALPGLAKIPLIESADGLAHLESIAQGPGVLRLAFGHLDFQSDLGMACDEYESELAPVRLAMVLASRRAGLPPPVDGVTAALQDMPALHRDCLRARRFGFGGKLCIHPAQVTAANDLLGPTTQEREWARRVMQAVQVQGSGVFRFEGAMVDAPVIARARRWAEDNDF